MFYWKEHFFEANVPENVQLVVKWRSCAGETATVAPAQVQGKTHSHSQNHNKPLSPVDDSEGEERSYFPFSPNAISSNRWPLATSKSQESPQLKCYSDIHNFGKGNRGNILKIGFSFDHMSLCKVPVILTQIENVANRSKKQHSSHEFQQPKLNCPDWEEKNVNRLLLFGIIDKMAMLPVVEGCEDKRFSIVPLRLFRLPNSHGSDTVAITIMRNLDSLSFISDYGLFYQEKNNLDNQNMKFQILFGHYDKGPAISVQNLVSGENEDLRSRKSDICLMDIFHSFRNRMALAVVCWTNSNALKKCEAFLSYSLYANSKYVMKKAPIDSLFPTQFEQIADNISIYSLLMEKSPPSVKSSSLVMLTSTKYVLHFSNGEMTHCVSMCDMSCICKNVEEFSEVNLKAISSSQGEKMKTILHIKDACLLIDWTNKKIRSLYPEGIHAIGKSVNGLLSILFNIQGNQGLAKSNISNINISEVNCVGHNGDEEVQHTRGDTFLSAVNSSLCSQAIKANKDSTETEMNDATRNVLSGLVLHEKGCQINVTDMEHSVRSKETFIVQTTMHFSDLKDIERTHLNKMKADLPPLVPLTASSELARGCQNKHNPLQRHWKVKRMWKRTIDKSLVCGVDLVQLSPSDNLHDIHLILVPVNSCQSKIQSKSVIENKFTFISSDSSLSSSLSVTPTLASSKEPSSPPRKRSCQSIPQGNKCDSSSSKSSLSFKLTSVLKTQGFWGCEDIIVQVYLAYSILQPGDRVEVARQRHKVSCGTLSVSKKEKLEETLSLKSLMKKGKEKDFFDADDMAALDCIQTGLDLNASCVLNPVTTLLEKLKTHPSITYLSKFDQYIYSTEHQLQFCRLKWLKQSDRCNATIRIFSRNQDDLLLFLEFLGSISPTDISFRLHEKANNKSKSRAMNMISSILSEKVEQAILEINKKVEDIPVEIPQTNKDDDKNDVIEIITDNPSPKFHGSVKDRNKSDEEGKTIEHQYPSTSGKATLAFGSDKSKFPSELDDELNQFDFGTGFASKAELEGKARKGLGTKKGSKSKLATKKR